MDPKKGRRVRKIEVPTDTSTKFELGDTAAFIQRRREEREAREREEAKREKTTHSAEEGVAKKCARTDRSHTEMDTEVGGEVGRSQAHSRHKKRHMTNIYLTDLDEEAIVDFVKDHKEL